MMDWGRSTEMTLELAQRASEPSSADQARSLAALRERLGLPAAPNLAPAPPTSLLQGARGSRAGEDGGAPVPAVRVPRWARSGVPRWLSTTLVLGGLGFWIGLYTGRQVAAGDGEPQAMAPSAVATASAPRPPLPARVEPPLAENAEPAPAPAASASPAAAMRSIRAARAGEVRRLPGARPRNPARAQTAASPEAGTDSTFPEAVRLLRRAQRALQNGNGAVALSLLRELDERFPRELLNQERQATRVLALCAEGEPERARRAARRLLEQAPRSIYAARLEQSCAAAADAAAALPLAPP